VSVAPSARRAFFIQNQSLRELDLDRLRPVQTVQVAPSGFPSALTATSAGFAVAFSLGDTTGRITLVNHPPPAPVNARFHAVAPTRLLDTRSGAGGPAVKLGPGATLDLRVAGRGGVPEDGATAVVLTLTAVDPTSGGFLTVWPAGEVRPVTSNLNFDPGLTVSNLVTVKIGGGGMVSLFNQAGSTDAGVDLAGWYGDDGDRGGLFHALAPARVLDTRDGTGVPAGPVGPGGTIDVKVTGRAGVPDSGVLAVVLNLTAVAPSESSFLIAWAAGQPRPVVSNVSVTGGRTVSSLVVVEVGPDGVASLYNHAGSTDIGADIAGWFGDGNDTTGGGYNPVSPRRTLDTRSGEVPLGPGAQRDVRVTGVGGVPAAGVAAVVLNLTAVDPSAAGFVTMWPTGQARPVAASLSFSAGSTTANLVVVKVGPDGLVRLYNHAGSADMVADVAGWFSA
jgi:hypothetical protein